MGRIMFGYLSITFAAVLSGWLGFHSLDVGAPVLAAVWFFIAGIFASLMLALVMKDALTLQHHDVRQIHD